MMTQGLDVILLREETEPTLKSDIRMTLIENPNLPTSVQELLFAAYARLKVKQ